MITVGPLDLAVVLSVVDLAPNPGFCALALAVLPYTPRALLVIFIIRLISWNDARNMIGFAPTSILVSCCEVVERLSRENVKSTLSKNRAESATLFMRVNDIPRSSIVKARIPCVRKIGHLNVKGRVGFKITC